MEKDKSGNMKKLLIYLTYDRQNIIDDYIGYFLHSMRPLAETIAVVCNMQTVEKGLHNLSSYADDIFSPDSRIPCVRISDGIK